MLDLLETAMKAAHSGLHVFPVEPGDKRPVLKGIGPNAKRMRWGLEATNDEGIVWDWWTHRCPTANIGVACKPSGLLIVDCDMPKENSVLPQRFQRPGVQAGEDVLACLVEDLGVPYPHETFSVRTPSGGAHYYFRNAANVPLRQTSPVPGWIDVRGNGGEYGGYVLGPGSSLPSGSYSVLCRAPIGPAPDWLLELCKEPAPAPARVRQEGSFAGGGTGGKLDGLVNAVVGAVKGNRNHALLWAACKYAEEGEPLANALRDLGDAATMAGLDPGEIEPTIRSGYRRVGR